MCTVTFIARKHGFALGMNRDEKLTRVPGRAPSLDQAGRRQALFPSEPSGGTWIGINDAGLGFALINWYAISAHMAGKSFSRGQVVRSLLAAGSVDEADDILAALPLDRTAPFRLIGFVTAEKKIFEWRWDAKELVKVSHSWKTQNWVSSGYDEPGAQKSRGRAFAVALRKKSAGSVAWLRRLHRSHGPACGPYSTCMHREDAATVSYTELVVSSRKATMRYQATAPCQTKGNGHRPMVFLKFKRLNSQP